ncbi:FG-GAP-like repeat-containing protein [Flavobacterium sp. UBA7682]|uniref:FG-GAP-like repeat-containing protein n=1 Tax=Flavobacterium sp. UBA7682 TaxID=1946560 RepID=UPI0025BBA91A|nr:FG-GAP-like repeat-containing protein [Flavobacterium sp. UBA7682]
MKKITLFFILLFVGNLSFAQDNCATALPITAGTHIISTINGTQLPTVACSFSNANTTAAEWYSYTPTQNYTVTVTSDLIENICKDTRLRIYSGNCTVMTCVDADDDDGVITCNSGNNNSYLSKITFNAIAGTTYYIVWDNRYASTGFNFQVSEIPAGYNPCNSAVAVSAGPTTVSAIDQININTSCSSAALSKWYSYTPTVNASVTVSSDLAENICKDTFFSVYTGNCTSGLTCLTSDDNSGVITCNFGNTNSNLSTKTFDVAAGSTYYIVWDNRWSNNGFNFTITEVPIIVPVNYTTQNLASLNSGFNNCIVDMNGDYKDDLVGVSDNNMRVHFQGNGGTFTTTDFPITGTSDMPYWSMAAGDYNKDGYNDLLLGSGGGLTFWRSNNTGTAYTNINPSDYIFCQRTNFVDINNDGNLDAFSCHDVAPNVYYINDGSANMQYYQSGTSGAYMLGITPSGGNYASLWTDFDNDGDSDMFISKCSGPPCEMHRNDGNGVFTDVSALAQINVTPIQTWSSAIADFDNDGDMDVIITASAGTHRFFRNNLESNGGVIGAFTNITAGSGWDTNTSTNIDNIAYDFDNDGRVDVLGGGGKIMFNQGNNVFAPVNYNGISVGAVGDLNNDGFIDFQNGTTIRYAVPNGNNWLKVNFQGIQSNRNGIGARVEIYGPWGKQIRDVRSGEGFRYMSTLNAHFGLGTASTINQVIVRWPSGIVDTFNNVAPNQALLVVEGATLATNAFETSVFTVYPNPVKSIINISINTANPVEFKLAQIYDLNGRMVQESAVQNQSIVVDHLATGTYILMLRDTQGKDYSQKFVKE